MNYTIKIKMNVSFCAGLTFPLWLVVVKPFFDFDYIFFRALVLFPFIKTVLLLFILAYSQTKIPSV